MDAFIAVILSMPTVVYTILLALMVFYWGLVIAGALDIHVLDFGIHGHDGGDLGGAESMLDALGLAGIPLTVVGSVWLLVAWLGSVAMTELLEPASWALAAVIFILSSILGFFAAAVCLRPFRGAFSPNHAKERSSLIGKVGTVSTLRVDGKFGVARIEDGGDVFEVHIRCPESNRLTAGSKILVIDYEQDKEAFRVVPATDVLPAGLLDEPGADD